LFPNKAHYKSDHVILDKVTYEHDLKDFYFNFIELPKFHKSKEELSSIEEKWCYFFKHTHETTEAELQKIIGDDNIIHRVYTALDQFHIGLRMSLLLMKNRSVFTWIIRLLHTTNL